MSDNGKLGKRGEDLAVSWLQSNGYNVLHRNWRYAHYELDIVASKKGVLHFVEVKTRSNEKFGQPEAGVGYTKITHLLRAGEAYQYKFPGWKRVQYDVLAIQVSGETTSCFLIEDIYL